jgi:hypothetical protein
MHRGKLISQNKWASGLCQSSEILNTRKHNVSELDLSLSVLGWGRKTSTLLGWVELMWPTVTLPIRLGVKHPFGAHNQILLLPFFVGKLLCSSSWGALSDDRMGLYFPLISPISSQNILYFIRKLRLFSKAKKKENTGSIYRRNSRQRQIIILCVTIVRSKIFEGRWEDNIFWAGKKGKRSKIHKSVPYIGPFS